MNHPVLRDLYDLPVEESQRIANERMAELGMFMWQFHVLEIKGSRYVVEAYHHHHTGKLGIVAKLKE